MRFKYLVSMLALSAFLTSCSSFSPNMRKTYKEHKRIKGEVARLLKKSKLPAEQRNTARIQIKNGVYIGARVHKQSSSTLLPRRFETQGVTIMHATPIGLEEIGRLITDATAIPVSVSNEVYSGLQLGQQNKKQKNASGASGAPSSSGGLAPSPFVAGAMLESTVGTSPAAAASTRHGAAQHGQLRIDFSGPLSRLLDHVAGYYDIGWTYKNGTIRFYRDMTRTFTLAAMPSQVRASSGMTSGIIGDGGATSGANTSANVDVDVNFWQDLEAGIGSIVGDTGRYVISKSSGSITVTAPYDVVEKIGEYIERLNTLLLRQVLIRVRVYTVTFDAATVMHFQPQILFKNAGMMMGYGAGSVVPHINPLNLLNSAATAARQLVGADDTKSPIVVPQMSPYSTTFTDALSAGVLDGKFKGTNAIAQLGDTLGKTSIVTSTSVTTMSGQPVPMQVGNTRGYVSKVATVISDTGTTTSVSTGTVNSGFSLNILPRVMDDGEVLVQYAMNISQLKGHDNGFNKFALQTGAGSTEIQLLDIDQRSFIQQALINNGATLVLAGFEDASNSTTDDGTGSPSFKVLGGGYTGERSRTILVIAITPVVLEHTSTVEMMGTTGTNG